MIAICATTNTRIIRLTLLLVAPRPPALSAPPTSARAASQAGSQPESSTESPVMPTVNARTLKSMSSVVQFGGASSGNAVVNNIMSRFQVDVTRQRAYVPVEDYNLIGSAPAGTRFGAHDLIGSATFRNPAQFDYRLAAGSKGIGAGDAAYLPADDLLGAPRTQPDLGAYGFAS